jgi:hypothetical protein
MNNYWQLLTDIGAILGVLSALATFEFNKRHHRLAILAWVGISTFYAWSKNSIWSWLILVGITGLSYLIIKGWNLWMNRKWLLRVIRLLIRMKLAKDDQHLIIEHIQKFPKTREIGMDEVTLVVKDMPLLAEVEEAKRGETRELICKEIGEAKVLWHRRCRLGGRVYLLDFDHLLFINPQVASSLRLVKHWMQHDLVRRFGNQHFDTLVYISRDRSNQRQFFEDLRATLGFTHIAPFQHDPSLRSDDIVAKDYFAAKSSPGKSVLLIETLLVDNALDDAFADVPLAGGQVNGVAILFGVKGFDVSRLKIANNLNAKQLGGDKPLQPQIWLDLEETH